MLNIIIMGNSSSGKSSLALKLVKEFNLSYLDLDTIAWENQDTPVRSSLSLSMSKIDNFINSHENWIIEGCYGDLIEKILPYCNLLIFLNLDIKTCLENNKNRPWEAHKYKTFEQQQANLDMLNSWIQDYFERKDEFSFTCHYNLFQSFMGNKIECQTNCNEDIINQIKNIDKLTVLI